MKNKSYYSIKEVSEEFQISYATLRYWEGEIPELQPYRNKRGVRIYSKQNIEVLEKIIYLVREKNMSLQKVKKALSEGNDTEFDKKQIINTLIETKQFLNNLKSQLSK
ncbi:MAG: MerR family transcriptional regulator [Bacteroidales bacterium]|nr:MerR family transcriptional regulator [Bacteroidales bacterium]